MVSRKKYNELLDRLSKLEIYKETTEKRLVRLEGIGALDKKKESRNKQVLHEYLHGKEVK